jgi:hypothetical protein
MGLSECSTERKMLSNSALHLTKPAVLQVNAKRWADGVADSIVRD